MVTIMQIDLGFKEFSAFLSDPESSPEVFSSAVEEMKRSTRKYAKRQIAWLQNKLLPAIQDVRARNGDKHRIATLYVLDATGKPTSLKETSTLHECLFIYFSTGGFMDLECISTC